MGPPAWEVQEEDAEERVQHDVCIPAQIHLGCRQEVLGIGARDLRVAADDPLAEKPRQDDSGERFDQVGKQER